MVITKNEIEKGNVFSLSVLAVFKVLNFFFKLSNSLC